MSRARKLFQSYGTLVALGIIIALFSALKPKAFFTVKNFLYVTRQIAPLTLIATGATLVMSVNEFDLSIGSMASLGGVIAAMLAVNGLPMPLCFLLPLLVCMALGLVNGFIVARFQVLSFITSLGMSTVVSGLIFRLTGGASVFQNIPPQFSWLGNYKLGSIPLLSVIMVVFVLLFTFFMRHTVPGRQMYAIGGNEEAARIAGIRVALNKTLAFILCAGMSAITGMLLASRVGSANTTAGDAYFLKAYAAVYIGCTVSRQGVPNVPGTLVGAAILGCLENGLTMLQMPTYMQDIITGVIIILAVILRKAGRLGKAN
ncbi:MAG: ABC transporter permease [Clostridia bacterium]|nr:ABC transporter permease [Clostridia bacterium]